MMHARGYVLFQVLYMYVITLIANTNLLVLFLGYFCTLRSHVIDWFQHSLQRQCIINKVDTTINNSGLTSIMIAAGES